jgi:glycosyltransferase involved in cell wall biosynthesis
MKLLVFNLALDEEDPVLGFTAGWVRALARECAEVHVVTGRRGKAVLPANVRVWSLGGETRLHRGRKIIRLYRILGEMLSQQRYDACLAHMTPGAITLAWPLLKAAGIPMTLWFAHKSRSMQVRIAGRLVDRVITPSAESWRVAAVTPAIVGHGIDTELFAPRARVADPAGLRIVTTGRVAPIKQLEKLIDALVETSTYRRNAHWHFTIVGSTYPSDQAYHEMLRRRIEQAQLIGRVSFAGHLPYARMAEEYQSADFFLSASDTGSVDKAVLEAMACGIPAITCNESFRHILGPVAPHLFVPEKTGTALSAAIIRLIDMNARERIDLGQRLRDVVVHHHDLANLVRRLCHGGLLQNPSISVEPAPSLPPT